ncbi:MAG: DMT family transporter [Pseudomonadota bacterium]|nr:DMT family transporter [Pseudomonadota bacterium]
MSAVTADNAPGGKAAALAPHAACLVASAILGSSFVAARAIMDHSSMPATLASLRYLVAALCLLPFVTSARHWRMSFADVRFAVALGVMQFGIFHLFVNSALQLIPAARGAVIFALIPVMTMLIAWAAGRDRMSWMTAFAAVLAFTGVALAIGEKALVPGVGGDSLLGEGLFFLAVCCGATYNAFSARLFQRHSLPAISAIAMASGALALFPFAIAEGLFETGTGYDTHDWLVFLWLAVPGGAVGMLLFNWGLQRLSPTRAAIWVPMSPIAATGLGFLLLGEQVTALFLVGLACAIAAPLIVARARATGR